MEKSDSAAVIKMRLRGFIFCLLYSPNGCGRLCAGTGTALPLLLPRRPLTRRRQVELPDIVRRLQTEPKTNSVVTHMASTVSLRTRSEPARQAILTLMFWLPVIESEHHEAQSLQVAKHLERKQREIWNSADCYDSFLENSSIITAWFGLAPDTAEGSRSWRTGSFHSRPGWRAAGPGKTPAGSPVQYQTEPPAPLTALSSFPFSFFRLHSPLSLNSHIPSGRELPLGAGAAFRWQRSPSSARTSPAKMYPSQEG